MRGMIPSRQRFSPCYSSRLQIDFGLVVQASIRSVPGRAAVLPGELRLKCADIQLRTVELAVLAPVLLGPIHCGVGIPDERLRIQTVVGINAHTDTCGDVKLVAVD